MEQILKVLSAISPQHRHQILEEARQQRSVGRTFSKTDLSTASARSCSTCSYFMLGVKVGEPNACNAFHHPTENLCAPNECPDWELK